MSTLLTVPLIEVRQPIGTFYLTALPAKVVLAISEIRPRRYDRGDLSTSGGVQRALSSSRVSQISAYTEDPDATFPTPIIIAVYPDALYKLQGNLLEIPDDLKLGEVIDGQHRIEGLRASGHIEDFSLPVTLMFDLTQEEKAYVFSIINSKQTPVNKSLIYELFALFENRSPQKTTHEVARLMNSDEVSPYFKRLKMLGRKEHVDASLSQGSFAKYFIKHLSRNPDEDLRRLKNRESLVDDPTLPLRAFFLRDEDAVIYKITLNYLTAVRDVFPEEWARPQEFILSKTTGFGALMLAFLPLCLAGKQSGKLDYSFFRTNVEPFRQNLLSRDLNLTSADFPSNESQQRKLADVFLGHF